MYFYYFGTFRGPNYTVLMTKNVDFKTPLLIITLFICRYQSCSIMKITTLFWTILLFYNMNGAFSEGKGPRFYPKSYVIPNDQKFMVMDAKDAFEGLTDKEQFYAHYLSR